VVVVEIDVDVDVDDVVDEVGDVVEPAVVVGAAVEAMGPAELVVDGGAASVTEPLPSALALMANSSRATATPGAHAGETGLAGRTSLSRSWRRSVSRCSAACRLSAAWPTASAAAGTGSAPAASALQEASTTASRSDGPARM